MLSIDHFVNQVFSPISDFLTEIVFFEIQLSQEISIPIIVLWLSVAGVIMTIYLGFPNFYFFKKSVLITLGKYVPLGDKKDQIKGQVSHFQALTAALSSTIGLGSIAGVAVAISIGGAGSTFWMIVAGFFGMTTKFVECTLGTKYRVIHEDGTVSGGPMYYIKHVFEKYNLKVLGKFLAGFFAWACLFGNVGSGGMFQLNQVYSQLLAITGEENSIFLGYGWMLGTVISLAIGIIVIRGIKSIVSVTDKIVPFMSILYLFFALIYLAINIEEIPRGLSDIVIGAFNAPAVAGGAVGAFIQGIRRATFSSEAGIGTASIAHATAKTNVPVTQGFVALLEPFIATIVISSATALVIICSGVPLNGTVSGIELLSLAFKKTFFWFPYLLFAIVFLFAVSTALTSAFYSLNAWRFITGRKKSKGLIAFYCIMLIIGTSSDLRSVIDFSDSTFFLMAIPNLIAAYLLLKEIKNEILAFKKNNKII